MPELELRIVEQGARSSLYASQDGNLYRQYHDTGKWFGPLPPIVDEHGVSRYSANRRVSHLVQQAWGPHVFRGTGEKNRMSTSLPHLRHALECLAQEPATIDEFATTCGVKVSTAWGYVCKVVEHWPAAHNLARKLVFPPLLTACESNGDCLRGTLKEVMERLRAHLDGDSNWRCVPDRYAHLRLARLCIEAKGML
jgi:hypothetical protein